MNIKDQYIEFFDLIRSIFDTEGYRPGISDLPKEVYDYFKIEFEFEKLEKSHQPNFIFTIENLETNLKTKIIIGASNLLFAHNLLEYREKLIANDFSGIATTKKAFFKNTRAIFAIIIFSEKSEKKYFSTVEDSEDLYNIIFDKKSSKQKIFYASELNENNLTPENYNEKASAVKQIFSNYKTKKLSEIAEIINGARATKSDLVYSGIPYLKSGCLRNGKIVPDGVCVKETDCERFAKQLLQEGDILVTKYFGQNKIVFVTEDDLPAIASDQLAIIRPHSVSDFNLYKYLSSNAGKAIFGQQLTSVSTGSTIKCLNLASLKEIEIPILDLTSVKQFEAEFELNHQNSFNDFLLDIENKLHQINESVLEKSIRNDLINAGWDDNDVVTNYKIYMKDRCFIPDFMLMDNNRPIACIEVKSFSLLLNKNFLVNLIKDNMRQDNILLILSIGSYYEVYRAFANELKVFKFYEPPKKEELLKIQKGGK